LKLDEKGCLGAPDLVIEALSPGTSKKEVKNKYEAYEEGGVKEYWIVDPIRQTVQIYQLREGRYVPLRTLTTGDVATTEVLPGFSLNLESLFSKI
jgi:Uma2 family endonuclease